MLQLIVRPRDLPRTPRDEAYRRPATEQCDLPPRRSSILQQQGGDPVKVSGSLWLALGLLPVYGLLAVLVPPFDDEIYYWCWSQELRLSYYDHPGMVAYMIRASTAALGVVSSPSGYRRCSPRSW